MMFIIIESFLIPPISLVGIAQPAGGIGSSSSSELVDIIDETGLRSFQGPIFIVEIGTGFTVLNLELQT